MVGVSAIPYNVFPLGQISDKGIKLAFGQAPVQKYIDELIAHLEQGRITLDDIITHRRPLHEARHGYEISARKRTIA